MLLIPRHLARRELMDALVRSSIMLLIPRHLAPLPVTRASGDLTLICWEYCL